MAIELRPRCFQSSSHSDLFQQAKVVKQRSVLRITKANSSRTRDTPGPEVPGKMVEEAKPSREKMELEMESRSSLPSLVSTTIPSMALPFLTVQSPSEDITSDGK